MNVAIIAAAGQGVRMGSKQAKQFLEIDGIPVIIHTLTRFEQCPDIDEVVVVLPEKNVKRFPALARKYGLRKVTSCIAGGARRDVSVRLGLESLLAKDVKIVVVHDAVRPFVTPEEISLTLRAAGKYRAAILVAPVTDTIKTIKGQFVVNTLRRVELRRALTPQCFQYPLLKQAFANTRKKGVGNSKRAREFTDESIIVETISRVFTIAGNPRNIKITQPEDIALAEIILKRNPEFRIKRPK